MWTDCPGHGGSGYNRDTVMPQQQVATVIPQPRASRPADNCGPGISPGLDATQEESQRGTNSPNWWSC